MCFMFWLYVILYDYSSVHFYFFFFFKQKTAYEILIIYWSSDVCSSDLLDQGGPFARSAADLALILQAMAGFDPKDSTSVNQAVPDYSATLKQSIDGLRIGLPSCFFQKEVDQDIQQAIHAAVRREKGRVGKRCRDKC